MSLYWLNVIIHHCTCDAIAEALLVSTMTDLITELYSTVTYLIEEISSISPRYLPAMVANTSTSLVFYIGISIVMLIFTVIKTSKHSGTNINDSV